MLDREIRDLLASRSNPVFEHERQKISWVKNDSSLINYRRTAQIISIISTLVVWIVAAVFKHYDNSFKDGLLLLTVYVVFVATLVADIFSGFTIANNLYRQINPLHWELLRTSTQSEKNIFDALYAIAQLHSWRPTAIEEALRIVVIELILLLPALSDGTTPANVIFSPQLYFSLAVFAVLVALYVMEVRWRTRAFIAFGLFIVSYGKNNAFAYLAQFAAILIVDLLQIASFIGFGYFFPVLVTPYYIGLADTALLALPLGAFVWCVCMYLLYRMVGDYCLTIAFKRMFAPAD